MALKDVFKVSVKTFINPRAWLGYDFLKTQTIFLLRVIGNIIKPFFYPPKAARRETFEEAQERLQLTDDKISEMGKQCFILAILFSLIAFGMIAVMVKFLTGSKISASIMSFAISLFMFAQAFKFHFWYFQIRQRKLGCTFNEWLKRKVDSGEGHG